MNILGLILFIIVWPQIQKGGALGFSFEKRIEDVENKVIKIEGNLEDIFSIYETEVFEFEKLDNEDILNLYTKDDMYYLDVKLNNNPIHNSINLWFFNDFVGPDGYEINDDIITIELGKNWDREFINIYKNDFKNLVVVQYIID